MPNLTTVEAKSIRKKLGKAKSPFTVETVNGRSHDNVKILHNGVWIARYGIQRSSASKLHNYISGQLHLKNDQAWNLAKCPMSAEDYETLLRENDLIE